MNAPTPSEADYIRRALATPGGHLSISQAGCTLFLGRGTYLSSDDAERWKPLCASAGLPVIDSRKLPFDNAYHLAITSPMIAIGEPACPAPWTTLSYAPLEVVAEAYRAAGAEVLNLHPIALQLAA